MVLAKFKKKKTPQKEESTAFDRGIISWISPDSEFAERGRNWKIAMSVLVAGSSIAAFLTGAWSFGLVILACSLAYYSFNRNGIVNNEVIISEIGIKVGKKRYLFSELRGFWIFYDPPYVKKLVLATPKNLAGEIQIQLMDQDPVLIRDILEKKIPEVKGRKESFGDGLIRLLKL